MSISGSLDYLYGRFLVTDVERKKPTVVWHRRREAFKFDIDSLLHSGGDTPEASWSPGDLLLTGISRDCCKMLSVRHLMAVLLEVS